MSQRILAEFSPGRVFLFSIFSAIIVGTLLLALPVCQRHPIAWFDLFFTATSSICVTGLFTIPIDQFTLIGHIVILFLIQLGGLGLITLTLFFIYFFMDVGLSTQLMASQLLEIDSWKNIRKILIFIIKITFMSEFLGTLLLYPFFIKYYSAPYALFMALFHAASAFCNAGIWLIKPTLLSTFHQSALFILIIMSLIFIGDLGFITSYEIMRQIKARQEGIRRYFSLHTKIVLYSTPFIVGIPVILFWLLEKNNILSDTYSWLLSLFYIISFRSAGFTFMPMEYFNSATLLLLMILGFIGAAPASTGSGIKITTFAIFISFIKSIVTSRRSVDILGRQIAQDLVHKAIAIIALSICWITITFFLLLLTESHLPFMQLLFEATMAFTNVGTSMGITSSLTYWGKIIIMLNMIIGRIGSLTLILALTFRKHKKIVEFSYPEERIMLG